MTSSKFRIPDDIRKSGAYQFAKDVVDGKICSGKRRIQSCKRFLDELSASLTDPDYPWEFDMQRALRPIDFIERFLVPTKGVYHRMELLPWQHFIEQNLYGWVSRETGYRRFREGIIIVGQGNGKSTLIAGNAAYGLTKDGERGAEVYCLANSKEQAKIIYGECCAQVKGSPMLSKHIRITKSGMYYDKTNSKFQPLAADSTNLDGRNVHMGVFDEIHEYHQLTRAHKPERLVLVRSCVLVACITSSSTALLGLGSPSKQAP